MGGRSGPDAAARVGRLVLVVAEQPPSQFQSGNRTHPGPLSNLNIPRPARPPHDERATQPRAMPFDHETHHYIVIAISFTKRERPLQVDRQIAPLSLVFHFSSKHIAIQGKTKLLLLVCSEPSLVISPRPTT